MKPSKIAILIASLWLALGLFAAFLPQLIIFWEIFGIGFLIILVIDAFAVFKKPSIEIQNEINHNLPIYSWSNIKQTIRNQSTNYLHLYAHDHYPVGFNVESLPEAFTLAPNESIELKYRVKPLSRGDFSFSGTDILRRSPLNLWLRKFFYKNNKSVRVFPDFASISKYILLATDNRLSQLGIKKKQRRGEGNDFHQLREYHIGDSLKQIDWKASSRLNKLISKEYQDERDQQIVFLLDCGRRMRHADEHYTHLDQAINSLLLLAYVAVQQGDAVGFKSFAGDERWVPPKKGPHVVNNLLHKTYDLPSTLNSADYIAAAEDMLRHQRRRSLVVIVTNTRDDDYDNLVSAIRLLSTRHLVILADLREESLNKFQKQSVTDLDSALNFHATEQFLHQRQENHRKLKHLGVICLDVSAEQLPIHLVNEYLNIKRSSKL
ncbi:MAG: DUF58 domain-containing protein [Gammaproteobacteria bacterium]